MLQSGVCVVDAGRSVVAGGATAVAFDIHLRDGMKDASIAAMVMTESGETRPGPRTASWL